MSIAYDPSRMHSPVSTLAPTSAPMIPEAGIAYDPSRMHDIVKTPVPTSAPTISEAPSPFGGADILVVGADVPSTKSPFPLPLLMTLLILGALLIAAVTFWLSHKQEVLAKKMEEQKKQKLAEKYGVTLGPATQEHGKPLAKDGDVDIETASATASDREEEEYFSFTTQYTVKPGSVVPPEIREEEMTETDCCDSVSEISGDDSNDDPRSERCSSDGNGTTIACSRPGESDYMDISL